MNNWIRRILIKLSIQSRTKQELMPSLKPDFKDVPTFRSQINYMKRIASESIQSAMTDEEARIVRDEIVSLFECCFTGYEFAVEDAVDYMDKSYQTFGSEE